MKFIVLLVESNFTFLLQIVIETQQARQALGDIEARHRDIIRLEKSIQVRYNIEDNTTDFVFWGSSLKVDLH